MTKRSVSSESRTAIDEVADEPEPVARRVELQAVEEGVEFVRAALDVADRVDGHRARQCSTPGMASRNGAIGASNCSPSSATMWYLPCIAPDRRLEDGAAGIAEALARLQVRLLADDAFADDFLHLAVGIGDEPVARHEAGGLASPSLRMVIVYENTNRPSPGFDWSST